ncbi:hypothetical protein MTR_1g070050 [Medicago truncatula]|uniref:Uncharacterized protein n=1 Tax=Medicago truncatula TaxID=3880 RepID=A0A072VWS2_MEDTR|nr:hypothetical protein MTR_1g070050 [Medicago truncatula]
MLREFVTGTIKQHDSVDVNDEVGIWNNNNNKFEVTATRTTTNLEQQQQQQIGMTRSELSPTPNAPSSSRLDSRPSPYRQPSPGKSQFASVMTMTNTCWYSHQVTPKQKSAKSARKWTQGLELSKQAGPFSPNKYRAWA